MNETLKHSVLQRRVGEDWVDIQDSNVTALTEEELRIEMSDVCRALRINPEEINFVKYRWNPPLGRPELAAENE